MGAGKEPLSAAALAPTGRAVVAQPYAGPVRPFRALTRKNGGLYGPHAFGSTPDEAAFARGRGGRETALRDEDVNA